MHLPAVAGSFLFLALSRLTIIVASPMVDSGAVLVDKRAPVEVQMLEKRWGHKAPAPKFVIISLFPPEAEQWYGIPEFNLLEKNITITNLSPLYPDLHCTNDYEICQITLGESEINAASSMSALILESGFDFKKTYFMVAGIAGINPEVATLGSVCFARYAVQVALQYEFDAREMPANFSTGYVPLGATAPGQYPVNIYGTEVFEVNTALRELVVGFASTAVLNDSTTAQAYRANYASASIYAAGAAPPSVVKCDVATSDVYYSGALLSEAFTNFTLLMTNGSGVYCTTAQEDNALLEAMVRSASKGLVDFSRIILMRTASDFDRPYPGEAPSFNLLWADQGGFEPSLMNIYLTGIKVIQGILGQWDTVFEAGINATNYVGDIFGTLGGMPDFGPYTYDNDQLAKRAESPRARGLDDMVRRKIASRRGFKAQS